MIQDLKTLLIVLALGSLAFIFGRTVWLRLMSAEDFRLRRNAWYGLTMLAFLSPSFGLFCVVALPAMVWLGQRDSNPLALYVFLMHIIPPISVYTTIGGTQLIEINYYRLLMLTVLLPYGFKLMNAKRASESRRAGMAFPMFLLICFCTLQIVQLIPSESMTNTFRRIFIIFLDCILLVYVFSRGASSEARIREILAALALMAAVTAPIALFESARGWLMYQSLGHKWGWPMEFSYLMRGNSLRAQVSSGHALVLGFMAALAFGMWLYLSQHLQLSKFKRIAGGLWFWVALVAAFSRAPWLTAVLIAFAFAFLMPRGMVRVFKLGLLSFVASLIVLATPMGSKIVDSLPFIGTVDTENVTYRQRLAEASWDLVLQYPFFGTPNAMAHLEHLRQGQGIIDLVNVYATVAMFHGFVGLLLFAGYFLIALFRAWGATSRSRKDNPEFSALGACLVALLLGTYFFMATGSFGTGLAQMAWILSAMALAYARLQPTGGTRTIA